jgi:signal transduction histidine kinase
VQPFPAPVRQYHKTRHHRDGRSAAPHGSTATPGSPAVLPGGSETRAIGSQAPPCWWLRVCVRDTGAGMSPEQLAHSLHWFSTRAPARRAGYGYTREHGAAFRGLGVGMPLSRVLARCMGGRLRWVSCPSSSTSSTPSSSSHLELCGAGARNHAHARPKPPPGSLRKRQPFVAGVGGTTAVLELPFDGCWI